MPLPRIVLGHPGGVLTTRHRTTLSYGCFLVSFGTCIILIILLLVHMTIIVYIVGCFVVEKIINSTIY